MQSLILNPYTSQYQKKYKKQNILYELLKRYPNKELGNAI